MDAVSFCGVLLEAFCTSPVTSQKEMSGCGAKNGERLQTRSMVEPWVPGAMSRHECICFLFVFLCHVQHTSVSKLDGCTTTMTGTESSWKCINLGHLRTWTLNDIDAFCACLGGICDFCSCL